MTGSTSGVPVQVIAFLAGRNLRRSRARTVLSVAGIGIGVVAVVALGMTGSALERSAMTAFGDVGGDLVVTPAAETGRGALTDREVGRIDRLVDAGTVVRVDRRRATVDDGRTRRVTVAYAIDRPGTLFPVDGRGGRIGQRGGVLVGADLAERLGVRTGSQLTVDGRPGGSGRSSPKRAGWPRSTRTGRSCSPAGRTGRAPTW